MTPPAAYPHNRRAQRVGAVLSAAAPAGLEVLTGTQAVRVGDDGPCPDVLVFAAGEYDLAIPADAVHLVVEVPSPSNRSNDTVTKLDLYARGGIPSYWVADPDEIVVHQLDRAARAYRVATTGRSVRADLPFPVTVSLD